tara:strand:+ start:6738 stop:7283 length:546 start_codon:yes stop_codon:yes gene_type:complete
MTIHEKLSLIQQEFKSKKSRYNSFGKYNFRSAEDILEALKPFNKKYSVYFTVNEKYLGDGVIESAATVFDADGANFITATALVGVDFNQKGMQVPQQFGSASSYGKKYALGNLLLIDDTADSDATNTHNKSSKSKPKLIKGTENWTKAISFVESGGAVDAILSKYDVKSDDMLTLKVHEPR